MMPLQLHGLPRSARAVAVDSARIGSGVLDSKIVRMAVVLA